jgi:hypothetical protein
MGRVKAKASLWKPQHKILEAAGLWAFVKDSDQFLQPDQQIVVSFIKTMDNVVSLTGKPEDCSHQEQRREPMAEDSRNFGCSEGDRPIQQTMDRILPWRTYNMEWSGVGPGKGSEPL